MSVSTCATICFPPLSQPLLALSAILWFPSFLTPFPLIITILLICSYLLLPSFALFSSPPHPPFTRLLISILTFSLARLLFVPFLPLLSIPCSSLPNPSCSPPRQIDVPSPFAVPIISFEQVLINDIHRLMNNSPKAERGRRGEEEVGMTIKETAAE